MNEQEEIKKLQQELNQLYQTIKAQEEQIRALYQRTTLLTGTEKKASPFQQLTHTGEGWTMENFIGLRLIHFIGIIVLVIGLSIGVKYAIDRNLISEGMRIGLAYAAGIVLFVLSFRLKNKYLLFSAILFSGAMASVYFTTYAAFVYYQMFSFPVSFSIMAVLTLFTVWQAVLYDKQEISILGLVGAYAIPFLISANSDRADLFFLYIFIINTGVVFLSVRKKWRLVSGIAQTITWILFIGWASTRSEMAYQETGLLFMGLFFILFIGNIIASRLFFRQPLPLMAPFALVANNLAVYIGALFIMGFEEDARLSFITLIVSLFTAMQALLVLSFWKEEKAAPKGLANFSLLLFILFIAFEWDGITVTLLWLLTAIVLFSWGVVRKTVPARMAAIVLMGVTLLKLVFLDSLTFSPIQKIISYITLGVLLLVVSFFYQKFRQQLFMEKDKPKPA